MKKYISPEINVIEFEAEDIIQTSGETPETLKTPNGAVQLQTQDFNKIFN